MGYTSNYAGGRRGILQIIHLLSYLLVITEHHSLFLFVFMYMYSWLALRGFHCHIDSMHMGSLTMINIYTLKNSNLKVKHLIIILFC